MEIKYEGKTVEAGFVEMKSVPFGQLALNTSIVTALFAGIALLGFGIMAKLDSDSKRRRQQKEDNASEEI